MSSNTHFSTSPQPLRTITGTALARAGEAMRAHAAAEWVAGRLVVVRPTVGQAASLFCVPPSTVKAALERAGDRRRRIYHKPATATAMSVDELLTLAASIEAATVSNGNGATTHST
jgi:hypothetical protein